ncbi:unnamed protein product [Pleuronectes platessa]|uniref:Uncharacterized protein n=1 Tax=Pleuronectes platessa TaxID=8262 RepID=A0A9N7YDK8_PLEPL|nr:unnamed protein product [Pleuronectes platessa]
MPEIHPIRSGSRRCTGSAADNYSLRHIEIPTTHGLGQAASSYEMFCGVDKQQMTMDARLSPRIGQCRVMSGQEGTTSGPPHKTGRNNPHKGRLRVLSMWTGLSPGFHRAEAQRLTNCSAKQ